MHFCVNSILSADERIARPLSSTYLIFPLDALYIVLDMVAAARRAKSRTKPVRPRRGELVCNDVHLPHVSAKSCSQGGTFITTTTDDTDNFLWQDK